MYSGARRPAPIQIAGDRAGAGWRHRLGARTGSLPPVGVVLLDLGHHPVELAGGDVGAAVLALAGLVDLERGAAVAARRLRAGRALAAGAADQGPVLAVRPLAVLRAADQRPGPGADHVVLAGRPDPDRDRVVVAIAGQLGERGAGDPHVLERV